MENITLELLGGNGWTEEDARRIEAQANEILAPYGCGAEVTLINAEGVPPSWQTMMEHLDIIDDHVIEELNLLLEV